MKPPLAYQDGLENHWLDVFDATGKHVMRFWHDNPVTPTEHERRTLESILGFLNGFWKAPESIEP